MLAVCDHRHPTKEAGHDCARSVAQELAEEAIEAYAKMAADMGSMEEQLRQAIGASLPGVDSITFANPDGSDETVIDLRSDGR